MRSQLVRDASGNLACPDDVAGLDVVTLSEGNAEAATNRQIIRADGPVDGTADSENTVPAPPVNWNAPPSTPVNVGPTGQLSVQVLAWLRGDKVTLGANGGVAVWNDQSNSGHSPVAPTLAAQPTWNQSDATLGGLPTVTGDGVNSTMQVSSRQGAPLWVWLIAKQNAYAGGSAEIFLLGFALRQRVVSPELSLLVNTIFPPSNAAATIGSWFRGICSFNVAGTDSLTIHSTTVTNTSQGQITGTAFAVFSAFNGGGKTNCSIAEILVTTPAPTAAEIAAIEAYGLARYGSAVF